MWVALSGLSVC